MRIFKPRKPNRSPRIDYTKPNAFHVVLSTFQKLPVLSSIKDSTIILSDKGAILEQYIQNTINNYKDFTLRDFVIMPNHVHLLIMKEIESDNSLPDIIREIKSRANHYLIKNKNDIIHWQRSFYDHVIRNDEEMHKTSRYIQDNPINWEKDKYFVR